MNANKENKGDNGKLEMTYLPPAIRTMSAETPLVKLALILKNGGANDIRSILTVGTINRKGVV